MVSSKITVMSRNIVDCRQPGGSTRNSKILTSARNFCASMEPFTSFLKTFQLAYTVLPGRLGNRY